MTNKKNINVLMMTTNRCNMSCKYCFQKERSFELSDTSMCLSVVEQTMKICLPHYNRVNFIWHGGEPLLMGLEFYKSVLSLQNDFAKHYPVKIRNSIQSNLTLINKEFIKFLSHSGFGIGGSFDGTKNELTRGNTELILQKRTQIIESNISCGFIFVVSSLNIDTLIDSYEFFNSNKINYSINLYIGNDNNLKLSQQQFVNSMLELFEYWANDINGHISISFFVRIIDYILRRKKSVCSYSSCLGNWLSIEYNGIIKPCNRHFPDEFSYGNIYDYNCINEAFESEGFKRLLIMAIKRREKCKSCEIFSFCSGGCNYVAMIENGIESNDSWRCKSLRLIYKHIENYIISVKEIGLNNVKRINPQLVKLLSE